MEWILLVTAFSIDSGLTSQQIPMTEVNCRHYEQQYNSGANDFNTRRYDFPEIRYRAQCLRAK